MVAICLLVPLRIHPSLFLNFLDVFGGPPPVLFDIGSSRLFRAVGSLESLLSSCLIAFLPAEGVLEELGLLDSLKVPDGNFFEAITGGFVDELFTNECALSFSVVFTEVCGAGGISAVAAAMLI